MPKIDIAYFLSYIMPMEYYDWNEEKNQLLKSERDISYEMIVLAINNGKLLDIQKHTNDKYAHQQLLIVAVSEYAYIVPFVFDGKKVFFKTIIPSRHATKHYLHKKGARI